MARHPQMHGFRNKRIVNENQSIYEMRHLARSVDSNVKELSDFGTKQKSKNTSSV